MLPDVIRTDRSKITQRLGDSGEVESAKPQLLVVKATSAGFRALHGFQLFTCPSVGELISSACLHPDVALQMPDILPYLYVCVYEREWKTERWAENVPVIVLERTELIILGLV